MALYYMGWNLGVRSPWLARSVLLKAPALQTPFHPVFTGSAARSLAGRSSTLSYPCVLRFAADDWRMWYGSNLTPEVLGTADMRHAIKLARSRDGIHWASRRPQLSSALPMKEQIRPLLAPAWSRQAINC